MRDGADRKTLGSGPGSEGAFSLPLLFPQVLQPGMWQVGCGHWPRLPGAWLP